MLHLIKRQKRNCPRNSADNTIRKVRVFSNGMFKFKMSLFNYSQIKKKKIEVITVLKTDCSFKCLF